MARLLPLRIDSLPGIVPRTLAKWRREKLSAPKTYPRKLVPATLAHESCANENSGLLLSGTKTQYCRDYGAENSRLKLLLAQEMVRWRDICRIPCTVADLDILFRVSSTFTYQVVSDGSDGWAARVLK